jgi:hypothetical protein
MSRTGFRALALHPPPCNKENPDMAFKNLLVHIDDSEANTKRLAAAIALAHAHGAHLTGIYGAIQLYLSTQTGNRARSRRRAPSSSSLSGKLAAYGGKIYVPWRSAGCPNLARTFYDIGEIVAWVFTYEEKGKRGKD